MKVLVLGQGGREHALAWKLKKSNKVNDLLVWPGNSLSSQWGHPLSLEAGASFDQLIACLRDHRVDLVICGPEAPLAEGLADKLEAAGIACFGPKRQGASLEASKAFAKDVMAKAGIPTAAYQVAHNLSAAEGLASTVLKEKAGVVIKASGLAGGKGVFVCREAAEVRSAIERLQNSMAKAADAVVVEEVLEGRECSYFTFLGQRGSTPLGFAVDFKRLQDNDVGPNTGGMGSYAPVPWLPPNAGALVEEAVVTPLLKELRSREIPYTGFLYVGLMWSPEKGPQVVEFNCRLGDPEAQILAVHDSRDWLPIMAHQAGLSDVCDFPPENPNPGATVGVVLASDGYPYEKSKYPSTQIAHGDLAEQDGSVVFGAAVQPSGPNAIATGSGRVFCVVATGIDHAEARQRVYQRCDKLQNKWPHSQMRRDIARRVAAGVSAP